MNSAPAATQVLRCLSSFAGAFRDFEKRARRSDPTPLMVRAGRRPTKKSGRSTRKKLDIWSEWSINENELRDQGHFKLRRHELKEGIER
jgi:hypothetical protein